MKLSRTILSFICLVSFSSGSFAGYKSKKITSKNQSLINDSFKIPKDYFDEESQSPPREKFDDVGLFDQSHYYNAPSINNQDQLGNSGSGLYHGQPFGGLGNTNSFATPNNPSSLGGEMYGPMEIP